MTVSKEDYLKAIYELGGQIEQVNNKDIAKLLKVSAPSVSEMIKKLLLDDYVEYTVYQGVKLTEYGAKEAMKIKRRHLLWEVFLVEKLGYSWDEVDEEAEKLEHVTSMKLEKRLDKYLNYPKTCPHGTPILGDKGDTSNYKTLDSLSVGESSIIRRLGDIKELLKYANEIGLKIGDHIEIISISPDKISIIIGKGKRNINIGNEFAKKIYVE